MRKIPLRRVGQFILRWPFFCLGLLTIAGFVAAENDALPPALLELLRVLIVPMWLMRMLQVALGIASLALPIQLVIAVPLFLLPYAAVDRLIWYFRHRGGSPRAAAV